MRKGFPAFFRRGVDLFPGEGLIQDPCRHVAQKGEAQGLHAGVGGGDGLWNGGHAGGVGPQGPGGPNWGPGK